ncbi:glycoside hydrolase family 127 protein [candidate division KSB1 bacterium]|nr:glycoside hydrolase family 127 protein [candidate division KSB1 bacterium]
MSAQQKLVPISYRRVRLTHGFWADKQRINREITLPAILHHSQSTGRIDAFKLEYTATNSRPRPHYFWDSDVYKWLEAAAFALGNSHDAELEAKVDHIVDLIAKAQQPDGYLNIYFTCVEPDKRWSNLRDWHELYCAGHLFEAAAALAEATGKRTLLNIACRFADLIDTVFGREPEKKRGYPGHEEIELALIKLYRATGNSRYRELARYFIDERGQQPHYFDLEIKTHGFLPGWHYLNGHESNQSHLPVRQQTQAVGHAVRAMYLYSGMADVAAETSDPELLVACERIWENMVERRMYVTGGIGSTQRSEGFTRDYDLPNRLAYAETCAAVGVVFWAHRMLQFEGNSRYADILETSLYNGAISGVSSDGRRFFYVNPLESDGTHHRQDWFDCACCPANIARLLASLGGYLYSSAEQTLYIHLFAESNASVEINGFSIDFVLQTDYPWSGQIDITIDPDREAEWTLALRKPGWCEQALLRVNDQVIDSLPLLRNGYVHLARCWRRGDRVSWSLEMPVQHLQAHPRVGNNAGRIALRRGPLVYCLEQTDNGPLLHEILIDAASQWTIENDMELNARVLMGESWRENSPDSKRLYPPALAAEYRRIRVRAIPYFAWDNRMAGEMVVWIRKMLSAND